MRELLGTLLGHCWWLRAQGTWRLETPHLGCLNTWGWCQAEFLNYKRQVLSLAGHTGEKEETKLGPEEDALGGRETPSSLGVCQVWAAQKRGGAGRRGWGAGSWGHWGTEGGTKGSVCRVGKVATVMQVEKGGAGRERPAGPKAAESSGET